MKSGLLVICHLSSVVLLTACTQNAAQVSLRGEERFSRNGAMSVASAASSYSRPSYNALAPAAGRAMNTTTAYDRAPTVASAKIDSIGVSDLPPPSAPALSSAAPKSVKREHSSALFIWPVQGKVVSRFGPKGNGKANDGINIAAENGEPVYAAADGEVVYVGDKLSGYGHMVILRHSGNRHTTYAHLGRTSVERYDRVKQGEMVGYVGSSGNVKESQLHFAIRDHTDPVNPELYLPSHYAGLEKK